MLSINTKTGLLSQLKKTYKKIQTPLQFVWNTGKEILISVHLFVIQMRLMLEGFITWVRRGLTAVERWALITIWMLFILMAGIISW